MAPYILVTKCKQQDSTKKILQHPRNRDRTRWLVNDPHTSMEQTKHLNSQRTSVVHAIRRPTLKPGDPTKISPRFQYTLHEFRYYTHTHTFKSLIPLLPRDVLMPETLVGENGWRPRRIYMNKRPDVAMETYCFHHRDSELLFLFLHFGRQQAELHSEDSQSERKSILQRVFQRGFNTQINVCIRDRGKPICIMLSRCQSAGGECRSEHYRLTALNKKNADTNI